MELGSNSHLLFQHYIGFIMRKLRLPSSVNSGEQNSADSAEKV